ncbi:SDR family NAD(P)-dependent oxidoreductase [Dactylosporangium sp. NPDC049525]|uniref:SDR family NAD(P)-dependent oxidoreductase n=1 Tax=Dactylosporangium sp. NPDC049525 TaxID=3154730 RepID=UPI00342EF705
MSKSIVVLGAGPGLGQAVAHRYAREGYSVVLVARRKEPLDQLAEQLAGDGARVHAIVADLADTDAIPALADRIRATTGDPDVLYYGVSADGFVPVLDLTPQRVRDLMPLGVSTLLALVQAFLPAMIARGDGAILSAQGASALHGNPHIAGGVVLAAQRNYLQALHAAVADKGVHVGGLFIGAAIEHTPFHAQMEAARAAGDFVPDIPTVDPAHLADLLWGMHNTTRQAEITYP